MYNCSILGATDWLPRLKALDCPTFPPIRGGVSIGMLVAGTFANLGFRLAQTLNYHGAG